MLRSGRIFLAGLMIGLIFSGVLLLVISRPRGRPIKLLPPPTPESLRVHVAGAVSEPGVYILPMEAIVSQAIEAAGGPLDEAILDMVNMAAELEDGQQIFVPVKVDTSSETFPSVPIFAPSSTEKININTAPAAKLEALPGSVQVWLRKSSSFVRRMVPSSRLRIYSTSQALERPNSKGSRIW